MVRFFEDNGVFGTFLWVVALIFFLFLTWVKWSQYQNAKSDPDVLVRLNRVMPLFWAALWFVIAMGILSVMIFSIIDYGLF